MKRETLKATCLLCHAKYAGTGMGKHLQTCIPKALEKSSNQKKSNAKPFFHIMVFLSN